MGLSLISPVADPQRQIESLQRELYARNRENAELREELRQEKAKSAQTAQGASRLREVLNPLYNALRLVFGEVDALGSNSGNGQGMSPVWESWKQKLGGQTAEAIDVLALHGEMNADQLRIHLRCARTHVYNVIAKLNKAGVINKNGGKISLKEL